MNKTIADKISAFNLPQEKKDLLNTFFNIEVTSYLNSVKEINNRINLLSSYSQIEQDSLNKITSNIVKLGYELEGIIGHKLAIMQIKDMFRELIKPWICKSQIMARALGKPRGYPGDYMMLEYIYDNVSISDGIGKYFDLGFLKSELTNAVRNRKNKTKERLENIIEKSENLKIVNLASGPCREIQELNPIFLERIFSITCVDFDSEALTYSKGKIKSKNISFLQKDIVDIAKKGDRMLFENSDIIYSIGLIDYFPTRLLSRLITFILSNLKSGGKLILTIKDRDKYYPAQEDWLTDWRFIPRTEKDIIAIINQAKTSDVNILLSRDDSGIIIFLEVTKK